MNEFKGTKGKWVVGIVPEYNDTLKSAMLEVQSEHYWVCKVQNNGMIQSEEGNANAQLIAHAPELLEMLQMWCMDMEERGRAYGDCYNMTKDLLTRATTI